MSQMWKILSFGLLIVATVAAVAAPAGAKNQVERPYKGSEQVAVTIDMCNEFFVCRVTTESAGTSSHLGKTSSTSDGYITFTGFCTLSDGSMFGSAFMATGFFTTTAANGDMIYGTYENAGCADGEGVIPGAIDGTQTILGGTGRFTGATGSTVTSGDNVGPLSWAGTLTY